MIDTHKQFQLQSGVFLKRPDVVTFDDWNSVMLSFIIVTQDFISYFILIHVFLYFVIICVICHLNLKKFPKFYYYLNCRDQIEEEYYQSLPEEIVCDHLVINSAIHQKLMKI